MSRGFLSALFGIGMTILSWYGPWEWPAWPAFGALHVAFGRGQEWVELPYGTRATVVAGLIALNVAVWAGVGWLAAAGARRIVDIR